MLQELREYKEYLARREALARHRQQNAQASGYYAAPAGAYPMGYQNARMNGYGGGYGYGPGMYGGGGYGYGGRGYGRGGGMGGKSTLLNRFAGR